MKRSVKVAVAIGSAIGLSVLPAVGAFATPWDGNDTYFQHGKWSTNIDAFGFEDVYVTNPANDPAPTYEEYTDIWDGAGAFYISLDGWGTSDYAWANADADVDVTTDSATGDLVFTAPIVSTGMVWDGQLDVTGELRVFSAGDLVRSTFFVKNTTSSTVNASFEFYTDWGSGGEIYSYQGQDDAILAVPAAEDNTSSTALSNANVQWVVHTETDDAPGAMAYGLKTAANPGTIIIDGDSYYAHYNDVAIPAGATVAFAVFHNWTPDLLVADNYTNGDGNAAHQAAYAAAATAAASEFETFSGRLTNGLSGYNVLNWGDLTTTPELPNTGADTATIAGFAGIAALSLAVGAGIVVIRRRATN